MRLSYSSVGGGGSSSGYALTVKDLEDIVAERFGYDPGTVNISGLNIDGGEFHISGRTEPMDLKDGRAGVASDQTPESEDGNVAADLAEAAIVFLNHLEDTLDDSSFEAVSTQLWNRVSFLASEVREAASSPDLTDPSRG
jgi:hypothetical protein